MKQSVPHPGYICIFASRSLPAAGLMLCLLVLFGCATQGIPHAATPSGNASECRYLLPANILSEQGYRNASAPRVSVVMATEAERSAFMARLPELQRTATQYSASLPRELLDCPVELTSSQRAHRFNKALNEVLTGMVYFPQFLFATIWKTTEDQLAAAQLGQTWQALDWPSRLRSAIAADMESTISTDPGIAQGTDSDTTIEVKLFDAGFAPSVDDPGERACLVLAAQLTLLKSGHAIWSDVFMIGQKLASRDSISLMVYCLPVTRWAKAGALPAIVDAVNGQVRNGLRERLPGLPWKPLPDSATADSSASIEDNEPPIELGAAVWWTKSPVSGRMSVERRQLIFFEQLRSGGEVPYRIDLAAISDVDVREAPATHRPAIVVVRRRTVQDADYFTLLHDDLRTPDLDRMRTARDAIAARLGALHNPQRD